MKFYKEKKQLLLLGMLLCSTLIKAQNYQEYVSQAWMSSSKDTIIGVNYDGVESFIKKKKLSPTETIVGILDTGFDFNHPIFDNIIWTNTKEIESNQLDDDNNQYIDDVNGWNFLGNAEGEDIERVGTAAFREYIRLRPIYKDKDYTDIDENNRKEYLYYKRMEKLARLDKYVQFEKYLGRLVKMYAVCDSLMTICYGDKVTDVKDFYNIEVADTTGVMLPLNVVGSSVAAHPKTKLWKEVVKDNMTKYELAHNRVKSLDNPLSDAHRKVGNYPEDFRSFHYGNNHINKTPYHGTMVAGLVALSAIKGKAAIKMMGIRTVPDGDEYDRDVVGAIYYAINNGAKVLNLSFGKKISPYQEEVQKAIQYAYEKDVLIVKASGNESIDIDSITMYPNNKDMSGNTWKHILTVGSSTSKGTIAPFSDYGKQTVDVLAPGVDIISTAPEGAYDSESGTSLSTPIVAGMATLIRSYFPKLSATQVKYAIEQSVTNLSDKKTLLPAEKQETYVLMADVCKTGGVVNVLAAFQKAYQMNRKLKK